MPPLDFQFDYRRSIAIDRLNRRPIIDSDTGAPVEVYHPFIPCIISSERMRSKSMEGLLDSGSDGMVIPMELAECLKLDLVPASEPMRVADGKEVERYTAKIIIKVGRGGRYSDPIEVEASVPKHGNPPVLIGRKPIFKMFVISFVEAERRLEMKHYRGKIRTS